MIRRNRRPDWRRIKSLRSYTVEEAATALKIHRNTVRYWIKNGLPVLTDQRPHLIQGGELVSFLKQRRQRRRQRCGPAQLFCLKCRRPQAPAGDMVEHRPSGPKHSVLIGICPTCETLMYRFVSKTRMDTVLQQFRVQSPHVQKSLGDTAEPRSACDFSNEN
jgi:hypothetical protein